jgi:hypothetical protein
MQLDDNMTHGSTQTTSNQTEPSSEETRLDSDMNGTTEPPTDSDINGTTEPPTDQKEKGSLQPSGDTNERANTNDDVQQDTTTPSSSDNLIYDARTQQYFTGQFNSKLKRYLKKTLVADPTTIDSQLLEDAKQQPNVWVSLPLGDSYYDSYDDAPPVHLITKVKCLYEQLDKPYCITYCMASALFYCGFAEKARDLAAQASLLASLHMNQQLDSLKSFLPNLVPLIGGATIYGKRCAGNNKRKRSITWNDLFTDITPYPTLVIPSKQDSGRMTHAFCVVDDLIFDSCSSNALKLNMDSVNWIFQNEPVDIFVAFRFDQKVSPVGHKVRGKYGRVVQSNWKRDNDSQQVPSAKVIRNKVYDIEYAVMPNFTRIDCMPPAGW